MRLSRSKSTDAAFAWLALICETHGILPIRMFELGIRTGVSGIFHFYALR